MSAAMNALRSSRIVTTERLMMIPPGKENLPDLMRLKGDERVFGWMLHGVRSPERAAEELEDDIDFWEVRGYGTWCVFARETGDFLGICGLMERPDGRGVALRYALWPECRGKGFAREAARAALAFAHRAGLKRIIAVARDENIASRAVLTDIGMAPAGEFRNQGHRMLVFESRG
ncbi:GNAT family N-acetyltransferase [Neoroseomonas soli]|uniref:GNAT family N-acetyltransferase n=1 Tax=Neoroseomonas soli TaxID=1081025 RepID=A0A9X9WWM8_9PROT|nr:GNAT family N-acetyltransferase [Neoroseomonas soli]MBR0671557.1 GNAT family N-acetyltransferase [Neoroseomonas soli]